MKTTIKWLLILMCLGHISIKAQTNLNSLPFCFRNPQHIMPNGANNWFSRPYHTDFDSDGDEDIVIYNLDSLKLFVYLNNGTGAFPTSVTTPTINNIVDITIGNLIGNDMSKDVALLQNDGSILLFKNTSLTTSTASIASYSILTPPSSYTVTKALSIDAKDYDNVNGDDLFVTYFYQTGSTPLFGKYCGFTNNGVGGFTLESLIGNIALSNSFTYADNIKTTFGNTNGDGYLDAIFSHTFVAAEVQETNNGSLFSTTILPTNLTSPYLPISDVQVENYDGLGNDDVGINSRGNNFATYSSPVTSSTLTPIITPTMPVDKYLWSDLNNDGKNEFVALNDTTYQFYINAGTASFAQFGNTQYNIDALNEIPVNFMIADFDNNGLNDIVTCGDLNSSGILSIIKNYSYSYLQMQTVSNHGGIVCSSNPVTLSVNTTTWITNPSYVWSPSSQTTSSIVTTNATTYYATITYTPEAGATCSITSTPYTVTYTTGTLPNFTITPQTNTVCLQHSGDSYIPFSVSGVTNYSLMTSYSSNANATGVNPNIGLNTYTVNGEATTGGCINTHTFSVFVLQAPISPFISSSNTNSTLLCAGSPIILTVTCDSTKNYLWLPGALTNSVITVNPTQSTTYTMIASNGVCKDTATYSVYVSPTPVINASISATTICTNQGAAVVNYSGTAGNTYVTSDGSNSYTSSSLNLNPTATTVYTVTATNSSYSACPTTDSLFTINVNITPTVNVSPQTATVCAYYSTTLTANGADHYIWSNGATTQSTVINPFLSMTVYTVTGQDVTSLCSDSKTITIYTKPLPIIAASTNSTQICSGSLAVLQASGGTTYSWAPVGIISQNISVFPIINTTYTVYGMGTNGCANFATVSVGVFPMQNINAYATPSVICVGETATLSVTGGTPTVGNYQNEIISPTINSSYPITIIDLNGCSYDRTAYIEVNAICATTVYNGFTPNGDGINDFFNIEHIDRFTNNKVSIFNRWGNTVFETTNYHNLNNAWDGKVKGTVVPNGTYFYVINLNDGSEPKKGWLEVTGQ
jgi:gliding motility-associated-like protein